MAPLDEVSLLITRDRATHDTELAVGPLEVLVYETCGSTTLHVPSGAVTPGEHATEAALRIAMVETGYDSYFTFRKLTSRAEDGRQVHVYQTSPETQLPQAFSRTTAAGEWRFRWLDEREAALALPLRVHAALARLTED